MKDRLISVADLLDHLGLDDTEENREENVGVILTLEDIDKISTAYDMDKVVGQLEKTKSLYQRLSKLMEYGYKIDTLNNAIKIVKEGGID